MIKELVLVAVGPCVQVAAVEFGNLTAVAVIALIGQCLSGWVEGCLVGVVGTCEAADGGCRRVRCRPGPRRRRLAAPIELLHCV